VVDISSGGGLDADDCSVSPPGAVIPIASLATSTATPVSEPYTLSCALEVHGPAAVGPAETGAQCQNNVDNDGDTVVNDGCVNNGMGEDSDGDTLIDEDGFAPGPAAGAPETFPRSASACGQ
jgi:hypothetical protein